MCCLSSFFRNPRVELDPTEGVIYAPAEGRVVAVKEVVESECLQGKCIQMSIFMSPLNIHVNRAPCDGQVTYARYHKGKYLLAYHPKASSANEHNTILLRSTSGHDVLVRQIAGLLARRICHYVEKGCKLQAGEEFGFIKFGSRVDLFLPLGTRIVAEVGTNTKCGKTVLAELSSESA